MMMSDLYVIFYSADQLWMNFYNLTQNELVKFLQYSLRDVPNVRDLISLT